MLKCITGILISVLLLIPSANVDESVVREFPQATDSWGRPVWYNHVIDQCQNSQWRKVGCPMELKPIVDKPE